MIEGIKKYYKIGDHVFIEYGISNMAISGEIIDFDNSAIFIKNTWGDVIGINDIHLNSIRKEHSRDISQKEESDNHTSKTNILNDNEEANSSKPIKEENITVDSKEGKRNPINSKKEIVPHSIVNDDNKDSNDEKSLESKEYEQKEEDKISGPKIVGYVDLSKLESPALAKRKEEKEKAKERRNRQKETIMQDKLSPSEIENIKKKEKNVNELIQNGRVNEAIIIIEDILTNSILSVKYISSFLLKKAQTYSSIRDYPKAKEAYIDLIAFNEKHNKDPKNLSHLYTELARLQSMNGLEIQEAINSAKKALAYNKNNTFASTLLEQLRNGIINTNYIPIDGSEEDQELIIETEDNSTAISKMIDIDIKEHKYTNEKIISNGGIPTTGIAKEILDGAKATTNLDLSERYPVYLEAAKAFSDLPVGSYDSQDYLESVAYYAILKGNSLFLNFKNQILKGNKNIRELTVLKDSACSYYMESMNLLTNISGYHLLSILRNYLKMNKALCDLKNEQNVSFNGQFDKIFFSCLRSDNIEYNEIAWMVIIEVGTASAGAWNSLCGIEGGIKGLYAAMTNVNKRQTYYNTINKLGSASIDIKLKPGEFLKQTFKFRKERNNQFAKFCNNITKDNLDVHTIVSTISLWKEIEQYKDLLSEADLESLNATNNILQILSPYINRNQTERTNILIQVQRILEKQISFINENTTYYGRTLFFPLYNKWKSNIQNLLDKKIADTLPVLQVYSDPSYIIANEDNYFVNLIIKNIGESTAEGCILKATISETNSSTVANTSTVYNREIPAGSSFSVPLNLPPSLNNAGSINLSISVNAIYQGKETETRIYSFTVEKEPESTLKIEEIPWTESKIPVEQIFKGRGLILDTLIRHYTSLDKDKPYILYGLTRTGKSSILKYLQKSLDKKQFYSASRRLTFATFFWDLSEAASYGNAQDLWQYLLHNQIYNKLDEYLEVSEIQKLKFTDKPRAKDFSTLLHFLDNNNLYPLILVDEFSFIKTLMDNKIVNSAFLHTLRQHSLEGIASFVYAGTYDIKELIKDPQYGIHGQLVNAVEKQISEIDKESAEELMNVIEDKLRFTEDAILHLHKLTGDIPYFIQMICKYCGIYAVEKKRSIIGFPELEDIVKTLTGEAKSDPNSMVPVLPENVFQNNMYNPADSKDVNVLISSIAYLNRNNTENPIGISTPNLQELWASKGIDGYRPRIAEAISILLQKKVLIQSEDEGLPIYKISVDLFRRWWWQHHSDINREIDTLV